MSARPALLVVCLLIASLLISTVATLGQAQEPDELRLAGPASGPETLDPVLTRDISTVAILRQIYRGLVYYDDELNPAPELAADYLVSEDGLTYEFTLRDGISFHDGRLITAEDVVYSLSRSVDPDSAGGDASLIAGPAFLSDIVGFAEVYTGETDMLAGVTAVSDRIVRIRLSAPRATFLMMLAATPAAIVDREQIEADPDWHLRPNGSGPFAVERWEPNDELVLAGFDDFALGEPGLDRVSYRLGNRAGQPFNLYQADEIDLDEISLFDLDRVTDPEGGFEDELIVSPQFSVAFIALRTDTEPLDDPNIRRALQLVFPRQAMAEVAFNGFLNAAYGVIPQGMLGAEWDELPADSSIQAARDAIAASRYGSPEEVPPIRIYSGGAVASEILREVAESELGLTIEVYELEWYSFLDRLAEGTLPAFELSWVADYPDPEAILLPLWGTERADNSAGYSNQGVDALLTAAAMERDPDMRITLYRQAQALILAENVVIPTFFDVQYIVRKPWVDGLEVTQMGILRLETISIVDQ